MHSLKIPNRQHRSALTRHSLCPLMLSVCHLTHVIALVEPIQPPMWRFPVALNGFAVAKSASAGIFNSASKKIAVPAPAPSPGKSNKPAATAEVTVRKLFPESWLWSDISTSV